MRIVLELTTGPERGRKMRLGAQQTISVGRTEWADFVVAGDSRLSSKHFVLESNQAGCELRDLGSANGTLVNGVPSKNALLKNGDKVTAGDSQFVVHIEMGTMAGSGANTVFEFPKAEAPKAPVAGLANFEIVVTQLSSGLYQARCLTEQLPPAEIATRLVRQAPMHMLVDFGRLGQPKPDAYVGAPALFDGVPVESAAILPTVISPSPLPVARPWLEGGWGLDALVCLFSNQPSEPLLSHLRTQARSRGGSMVGYCWPAILGPLLANYPKNRAAKLLEGIDYVLIEDGEAPEYWQVFSFNNIPLVFDKLGLRTVAPAPNNG